MMGPHMHFDNVKLGALIKQRIIDGGYHISIDNLIRF